MDSLVRSHVRVRVFFLAADSGQLKDGARPGASSDRKGRDRNGQGYRHCCCGERAGYLPDHIYGGAWFFVPGELGFGSFTRTSLFYVGSSLLQRYLCMKWRRFISVMDSKPCNGFSEWCSRGSGEACRHALAPRILWDSQMIICLHTVDTRESKTRFSQATSFLPENYAGARRAAPEKEVSLERF